VRKRGRKRDDGERRMEAVAAGGEEGAWPERGE